MVAANIEYFGTPSGNPLPILPVLDGSGLERASAVTTAVQVHDGTKGPQIVRVWAIGFDLYYKFGTSAVAAPTAASGFIPSGAFLDVPVTADQQFIRVAPKTGTGTWRAELLGT